MIQTSLSTLLSSYLWGLMLLVGLIWLTGEWHRRHRRRLERRHDVICRLCHDGIHDLYDEMTLAKHFASTDALLADEALARHFAWVARQRLR